MSRIIRRLSKNSIFLGSFIKNAFSNALLTLKVDSIEQQQQQQQQHSVNILW